MPLFEHFITPDALEVFVHVPTAGRDLYDRHEIDPRGFLAPLPLSYVYATNEVQQPNI